MFSKRRPKNLRKRPLSVLDEANENNPKTDEGAKPEAKGEEVQEGQEETQSSIIRPAPKAQKPNPLIQTSIKEKKKEVKGFQSDRNLGPSSGLDSGATRSLEIDTAHDHDAIAIQNRTDQLTSNGKVGDGAYRGQTVYLHQQKKRYGPQRAAGNVRAINRIDYQPDVCKDYKETGTCGFGDSCVFLHDRGDYKSGWELDKEWEEAEERRKAEKEMAGSGDEDEEDEEDDEFPFACYICKKSFMEVTDPVVTKCEHYFCEGCALAHNAETGKCFVCEQATHGIFNKATRLIQKIKKKKGEI